MKFTENQIEVLKTLIYCHDESGVPLKWCTPLDLCASNGSHHSGTLNSLAKRGLVQFKQRYDSIDPPWGENGPKHYRSRGSKCYRITPDGRNALQQEATDEQA